MDWFEMKTGCNDILKEI